MRRIPFILIIVSLFYSGCKGKEIRPSADFLLSQNAIDLTSTIREAYERKDDALIREKVKPSVADTLLDSLVFEEARLSFNIMMIRITPAEVRINLNWTGEWLVDGKRLSERGVTTLAYEKRDMRLIRIEGDNPFLIPHGDSGLE